MNRHERRSELTRSQQMKGLGVDGSRGPFALKQGQRLALIRPQDPELAMTLVEEAEAVDRAGGDASRLFDAIPTKQPYTFVGFLSFDGRAILDGQGTAVGRPERGDSYVNERGLVGMKELQ